MKKIGSIILTIMILFTTGIQTVSADDNDQNNSQSSSSNASSASSSSDSSQDTSWKKPVMMLGNSLTATQKDGTMSTFRKALANNNNNSEYETQQVTGADLVKYLNPTMDNYFNDNSGVWSSAMVEKTAKGSGINVTILNYNGVDNITTITQNQYKNAALTAGVTDANIYVTSAVKIDGSGALAGVYAAFSNNGSGLDQNRINLAQQEQKTLSNITEDNSNKKGYTDSQLNNAVAQTKQQMAQSSNPQDLSQDKIADILDKTLQENKLNNLITQDQRQQLIDLLTKIAQSGAMNSGDFKTQAAKLSNNIMNGAKNIFNNLGNITNNINNNPQTKNFLQKIIDAIVSFFQAIANFFVNIWNSITGNK